MRKINNLIENELDNDIYFFKNRDFLEKFCSLSSPKLVSLVIAATSTNPSLRQNFSSIKIKERLNNIFVHYDGPIKKICDKSFSTERNFRVFGKLQTTSPLELIKAINLCESVDIIVEFVFGFGNENIELKAGDKIEISLVKQQEFYSDEQTIELYIERDSFINWLVPTKSLSFREKIRNVQTKHQDKLVIIAVQKRLHALKKDQEENRTNRIIERRADKIFKNIISLKPKNISSNKCDKKYKAPLNKIKYLLNKRGSQATTKSMPLLDLARIELSRYAKDALEKVPDLETRDLLKKKIIYNSTDTSKIEEIREILEKAGVRISSRGAPKKNQERQKLIDKLPLFSDEYTNVLFEGKRMVQKYRRKNNK
ncbi:hypothetical protein IVG45_19065 [Methylomonas sp. LL1]|uniref:hypothetical protein n=1 Tax=Methylomonas sp. LL1 TaxID=2785785 RepID=UPI0018C3B4CA|nr:hypothetical protein [Methylomonas sp. LL1]QPK62903.1 hypothetical protein IVG45_19065 [Methylomonas sp. LL1]